VFNKTGFSNYFKSLKNRTAGRKIFFDTLKPAANAAGFGTYL